MAKKRNVKLPEPNKKDSNLKGEEVYKTEKIPYIINPWRIAGRQEIMEMRRL